MRDAARLGSLTVVIALAALLETSPASAQDAEQIVRGAAIYKDHCSLCHGQDGKRGQGYQTPIWGAGTQIKKFKNGQGLFEYLQFLMPFDNPNTVTEAQKWDVVAYMLANHGAIKKTEALTPQALAAAPIP